MIYTITPGAESALSIEPPIHGEAVLAACKEAIDAPARMLQAPHFDSTTLTYGPGHSYESARTALTNVMAEFGHVLLEASNVQHFSS